MGSLAQALFPGLSWILSGVAPLDRGSLTSGPPESGSKYLTTGNDWEFDPLVRHQPVRTDVKQQVHLAQRSLLRYRSRVLPIPRHVRTNSHLPTLLEQRHKALSSLQAGFPHCPLSRVQEV